MGNGFVIPPLVVASSAGNEVLWDMQSNCMSNLASQTGLKVCLIRAISS